MSAQKLADRPLVTTDFESLANQQPYWDWVMDRYFRLEMTGFENVPDENCLIIGNHGGGAIAWDAWMMFFGWMRHFGESRPVNFTAHDVLTTLPKLGPYLKSMGIISPTKETLNQYLQAGRDTVIFPGGVDDAMRAWKRRDEVVFAGRKGFIRLAIRNQKPILPITTAGGHDCEFILSEGRGLAKLLRFPQLLRSDVAPITFSVPFGVSLEVLPWHLPLPAKIRTEILEPMELDKDCDRADDNEYVDYIYNELLSSMQANVNKLASKRRFPVFS